MDLIWKIMEREGLKCKMVLNWKWGRGLKSVTPSYLSLNRNPNHRFVLQPPPLSLLISSRRHLPCRCIAPPRWYGRCCCRWKRRSTKWRRCCERSEERSSWLLLSLPSKATSLIPSSFFCCFLTFRRLRRSERLPLLLLFSGYCLPPREWLIFVCVLVLERVFRVCMCVCWCCKSWRVCVCASSLDGKRKEPPWWMPPCCYFLPPPGTEWSGCVCEILSVHVFSAWLFLVGVVFLDSNSKPPPPSWVGGAWFIIH